MVPLEELLERQDNIITRAQALAAGLSRHAIAHRLGGGRRWTAVLPSVYAAQTGPLTQRQRWRAALAYGGTSAMLGGPTAASAHGLRNAPRTSEVHLLLPHQVHRACTGFVVVQRSARLPTPWRRHGVPVAPVARAVVDSCRSLRDLSAVRALMAEAVQGGTATVGQLGREVELGPSRGSRLPRQVLAEVADGVRSAAEGLSRELVKRAGLPDPLWNPDLFTLDGQWIARPDAWWPREGVALEIDSRQFHLSPADWQRTLERHERMTAYGILVVHVAPKRVMTAPRAVTDAIRRTLDQGRLRPPLPIRTVPANGCAAARP